MTTLGFVLEYGLGHITHAQNLKRALADDPSVAPAYVDLPYDKPLGWWSGLPGVRSNWSVRAALGAYLALRPRGKQLDAAYFHTQITALFSTGLMRKVPSVVSLDATPLQYDALGALYNHAPSENARLEALKKRMTERVFDAARHLVTFSQWAKDSLVTDYGVPADKVTVIPPAIDLTRFHPDSAAKSDDGVTRLLFVGGDFARKGGDLVTRWAQETQVTAPFEVHVVTRDRDAVPPLPCVIVHTEIANNSPELVRLYQQSDVFVLPTRADCSSWVGIEAAACGLPVVTTRVGGVPEIVLEGETGYIVGVDDFAALSSDLDALVSDASLRARFGVAGRHRAQQCFDATVNYRQIVHLLKTIAAK